MVMLPLTGSCLVEAAEEVDSKEVLEFDEEQYPQLLENIMELCLHHKKTFLRQFMAAARCMYYSDMPVYSWHSNNTIGFYKLTLTGHTPWTDIAENPSNHLSKKSQLDCDHRLEEPSHMKSDAIDSWLRHWLKLQKKHKHPLVLRDTSDKQYEWCSNPTIVSKRKVEKSKAQYIQSDSSEDEAPEAKDNNGHLNVDNPDNNTNNACTSKGGETQMPISPLRKAASQATHRTFLVSLSDDGNYQKLVFLLHAAKVSKQPAVISLSDWLTGWRLLGGRPTGMGNMGIQQ
jgi:hypothetical protein